ncbi:MAG: hypothetical protein NC548_58485 [Lachnospiraceae bacterium]|nr:hypothetical protein [Lachnospiraceae bacterium]
MDSIVIYEEDKQLHHHLIPLIYRGKFSLTYMQNNFYSVNSDLPGKDCINNIRIFHEADETDTLTIKIDLNDVKYSYMITAQGIGLDRKYQFIYNENNIIRLPIDEDGYLFSIAPMDYMGGFMTGTTDGFTNTIKFLNLPPMKKDIFQSGGYIEISLPLFNDDIFTEWCINGDIMQFENNKILFHGQEFNIYKIK